MGLVPLLASFVPRATAVIFLVSSALKACVDLDYNFDSIAYHLPFAALRVGLVTESQFRLTGVLQNYYDGFPMLASYLKGWLWRLSGKPEAVNLLSVVSLWCLIGYATRVFRLKFEWVVIGLAAIPVVLVSVARNQIDLPANCFMTILALSVCDWYSRPDTFGKLRIGIAVGAAALTAHFKPQLVLHVAMACVIVGVIVANSLRAKSPLTSGLRKRPVLGVVTAVVSFFLIFSEVLSNWVKHRNPFYPMEVKVSGLTVFPGPLTPWGLWPQPMYSAHYFQPLRWLLSVVEFRAFDFRRIPYTVGNGDVPMDGMSAHAGGYMGLAVMLSLGLFLYLVWRRRDRAAWTYCVALGVITVLSAIPPGSQEIRYAVYWMMFLVLTNLIMLSEPSADLIGYARMYKLFLLCELIYVCLITGGEHIIPEFRGLARYEKIFHTEEQLEKAVRAGDTICLSTNYQTAFMYAPTFHQQLAAQRPYSVRVEHFTLGEKDFISPGGRVCNWLP